MSECPEYYRVSDGREFWEFFRDECYPVVTEYCLFSYSQCHALESACEYLFRSGIKTPNPVDDIRKALRLIDRAISMETSDEARKQAESLVAETVGKTMLERAKKMTSVKEFRGLDPIVTAWGTISNA